MSEIIRLGEVATIDASTVDKKSKDNEQQVRLCNFVDVYRNWVIVPEMVKGFMVATANQNEINKFSIKNGQVAITKDSETRDDIGIPTYITGDYENVILGYHCTLITPDSSVLNGEYLNAVLHTEYAKKYFAANASGSGQRYTLAEDVIAAFPVPLVPLNIQAKIGRIFSDIALKDINNDYICVDLENMLKLLYEYWFVQFDFPDENGQPYKSSGGKMVWNEEIKREIPEGWRVIRLGDYITADRGISYSSETLEGAGVPMINLASFSVNSIYKHSGIKSYSGLYGNNQILKPYDLIMCNTQQTAIDLEKDIIGKTILVPDIFDSDIVSSHHITHIRTTNNSLKYYINAESKTTWFHRYAAGFASGTKILGLDFEGIQGYKMILPPQHLLDKFAKISHDIESKKSQIIRENIDLVSLRDLILPLLITGQARLKEI